MKKSETTAPYWLVAATVVVLLVQNIPIFVEYSTFIHPWRAELAGSILLIAVLTAAYGKADFRNFVSELPKSEIRLIILPCAVFILWSVLSAIWARSPRFALYHSAVWVSYLAFYAVFRYYTRQDKSLDRWIAGMMVLLWILGVPAITQFISEISSGLREVGLIYSKYTELANTIVPLVAAYALKNKGTSAIFGYATVILVWLFDNATASRTGVGMFVIEGVALVALTFILPSLKEYRWKAAGLAAALIVLSMISVAALSTASGSVPIAERAGDAATAESTSVRPFFLKVALQMWRENAVLGVGADNFGISFGAARRAYSQSEPDDPMLRLAEDELPDRAHNEYGQVLAELGIVGIAVFAAFIFGVVVCATYLWSARKDISLTTAAALVGVGAFLASSLVTSYSFRIFQNGIAFFFVLSVAVAGTLASGRRTGEEVVSGRRLSVTSAALLATIVACVFLGGYCIVRVAALYEARAGTGSKDPVEKYRRYERALKLDPDNAEIYQAMGLARLTDKQSERAAANFRQAIDRGAAWIPEYSLLATAQLVSKDISGASRTIDEALVQFPRSAFLHVRSGILLKSLGRTTDSERQFQLADELDPRQAATWRVFVESGAERAADFASYSGGLPLKDLRPMNCLGPIQKERELLYPDEKMPSQ